MTNVCFRAVRLFPKYCCLHTIGHPWITSTQEALAGRAIQKVTVASRLWRPPRWTRCRTLRLRRRILLFDGACQRSDDVNPRASSPGAVRARRVRGLRLASGSHACLSHRVHRRPVSEGAGGAASGGSLLRRRAARAPRCPQGPASRLGRGKSQQRRRFRLSVRIGQVRGRGDRRHFLLGRWQ